VKEGRNRVSRAARTLTPREERDLNFDDIRKATFVLPRLGPRLEHQSRMLREGRGFCVLRGLDPTKYSREDNVIIYVGISSYFGEQRGRQYQDGMMLSGSPALPRPEYPAFRVCPCSIYVGTGSREGPLTRP
jgi:hypothetical protein